MKHLFFDTNILESYPYYKNQEYQTLQRLKNEGFIRLHLPWVVEKEYIQHRQRHFNKHFLEARKKIRDLVGLYCVRQEDKEKVDDIFSFLDELRENAIENIESDFQKEFIETLEVQKEKLCPNRILNFFETFYANHCNDNSAKDIPDGLIIDYIKHWYFDNKEQNIVILSRDKKLLENCKRLEIPFLSFGSIQDFIIYHNGVSNFSNSSQNNQDYKQIITQHLRKTEYKEFLESLFACFRGADSIAIDNLMEIKCDCENTIMFDSDIYGVSIRCNLEVTLGFCISWNDYYAGCFEGYNIIDLCERNEHYCDVVLSHTICLRTVAVIDLQKEAHKIIGFQDTCVTS